jgi:hypothetical protein
MDLVKVELDGDGESCETSGTDGLLTRVKEEREDPLSDFEEFKTESGVSCTSVASGGSQVTAV